MVRRWTRYVVWGWLVFITWVPHAPAQQFPEHRGAHQPNDPAELPHQRHGDAGD